MVMKWPLRFLTRTAVLLALTLAFQSLKLSQAFTGPAVNAMLFIAAATVGMGGGALIGLITPWVALSVGILKPVLAPAVPFIMLGNASLVVVYGLARRLNDYLAILAASLVKFLILFGAVRFVLELNPKVSAALQFPQLFTALGGGAIALVVLKVLKAAGIWSGEESR